MGEDLNARDLATDIRGAAKLALDNPQNQEAVGRLRRDLHQLGFDAPWYTNVDCGNPMVNCEKIERDEQVRDEKLAGIRERVATQLDNLDRAEMKSSGSDSELEARGIVPKVTIDSSGTLEAEILTGPKLSEWKILSLTSYDAPTLRYRDRREAPSLPLLNLE